MCSWKFHSVFYKRKMDICLWDTSHGFKKNPAWKLSHPCLKGCFGGDPSPTLNGISVKLFSAQLDGNLQIPNQKTVTGFHSPLLSTVTHLDVVPTLSISWMKVETFHIMWHLFSVSLTRMEAPRIQAFACFAPYCVPIVSDRQLVSLVGLCWN